MDAHEILSSCGLKVTRQRQAIVEYLMDAAVPVTAEDIYRALSQKEISLWLSTVYRTLEQLSAKNVVRKTMLREEKNCYELVREGHRHYLICLGCNRMIALDSCPLHDMRLPAGNDRFQITGHRLELYGYCEKCQRGHH